MKYSPLSNEEERAQTKDLAREKLLMALEIGRKIVFADETCFTSKTLPRKTFVTKGNNIQVDVKNMHGGYRSALAGISTDGKVEHLKVT